MGKKKELLENVVKNYTPDYELGSPASENYNIISIQANCLLSKIESKEGNLSKAKSRFDEALYQFEQMTEDENRSREILEFYHREISRTAKEIYLPLWEQLTIAFIGQNLKPKYIHDYIETN